MPLKKNEVEIVGEFCFLFSRFERFLIDHDCFRVSSPGGIKVLSPSLEKFKTSQYSKHQIETNDLAEMARPLGRYQFNENSNREAWEICFGQGFQDGMLWDKMKQVRNNLFHGNKVLEDKERDLALMKESISVLKRLGSQEPEFRKYL